MCIPVIYCMCVPVVYGKYICHHSKFLLGVSEYVSKSQKWPDHTDVQCQNGQTAMRYMHEGDTMYMYLLNIKKIITYLHLVLLQQKLEQPN